MVFTEKCVENRLIRIKQQFSCWTNDDDFLQTHSMYLVWRLRWLDGVFCLYLLCRSFVVVVSFKTQTFKLDIDNVSKKKASNIRFYTTSIIRYTGVDFIQFSQLAITLHLFVTLDMNALYDESAEFHLLRWRVFMVDWKHLICNESNKSRNNEVALLFVSLTLYLGRSVQNERCIIPFNWWNWGFHGSGWAGAVVKK